MQMIHVVFNEPDVEILNQAIEMDETMAGEVVLVRDDFAVGPLANIYTPEGQEQRKNWWRNVFVGSDYEGAVEEGKVDDPAVVTKIKELLTNDEKQLVWIWAAQNKHDVCGYYWLISQLVDFHGRVYILYLNNLPFINEKGNIFYPDWLSQIQPKEFLKAKKLARPVTVSEFEVDSDEWNKITQDNHEVRLLEGGKKIVQRDISFYDQEISKYITGDFQKANKIINAFLTKSKETTGDGFVLWRLKMIAQSERFEFQGELKGMKDFEVKRKSVVAEGA
ncbi:MAG: hypothetical protein RL000_224 [Bacteroidota bacterium]|jgi:hypothetical protein